VAELGAGIALEGGPDDAGRVGEALEAVLWGPTHREAAQRVAADIAALPPVDEAPEALEDLAAGAFRPV
jgi:UDP:flavonoid glycosyltransferase YjiC (YdhE family)